MPVEGPDCARQIAAHRRGDLLETALWQQREDWRQGIRTAIADRLKACPAISADPVKAAELIYADFELRRDAGEAPDWDELLLQFPDYTAQLRHFREADEFVECAIAPTRLSATQLGNYDLLEEVGRGGMGVVYRARERNLDRTVAIKRVRDGALADDDAIQRCLQEAKAVSRLNHPNIVHIYRVSDCDGEPFIALEFVEGLNLAQRIGGTPLAPRLAGMIGAAVARAIQHAHEHGIIHRDLKPANILLSGPPDKPVPKVTDFGAAKELARANDAVRTRFLGTPSYMAPEQVESKCGLVSERTDVYGIGTVLYEALTGRPPFRADSIGETLRQVTETQPVSPRLLNPAVPRDLETVCLKCLQKESCRRYESAAALADDLDRFLAGQPIHARPIGPVARSWMWCRRKPGTASLVAVLLFALMGGMAGITIEWRRAEAAHRSAVASDLDAQRLLSELIESNPADARRTSRPVASIIDVLRKAETHCTSLLQKNPDETPVRIALTKVYGRLNNLYCECGQASEAETIRRQARALWEPLANATGNAEWRYWLAVTYSLDDDSVPRFFQSQQHAEAIWQDLAQEQPNNLDLLREIWRFRTVMAGHFDSKGVGEEWLSQLQESQTELQGLVRRNPGDRVLRKRLALRCFLLGEVCKRNSSAGSASSFWHESFNHYKILIEERPDDLLDNISLAICCSRLIGAEPTDPYYLASVPSLDRAGRRLNALLTTEPTCGWLRNLLLDDYCWLALCHAKAGQMAKAEQAAHDCTSVLATRLDWESARPEFIVENAARLIGVGHLLRDAKQPAAALRLVRLAASLCSRLAADPSHELSSFHDLGHQLTECSALANQLGEPALALEQAELARRTIEGWVRAAPDDPRRDDGLNGAWERIGKARWSLGHRDQALAAFWESAAVQKRVFEREPSNHMIRVCLSQCYNRLAYYGSSAGDLRGAARAILERTKLWPDNANQLIKTSEELNDLAGQVTSRGRGHLSVEDQAERDRYLAESRRVRQAAETAKRRAGHDLRVQR
jgi:tetratricopeptide (TPR) repeat protein